MRRTLWSAPLVNFVGLAAVTLFASSGGQTPTPGRGPDAASLAEAPTGTQCTQDTCDASVPPANSDGVNAELAPDTLEPATQCSGCPSSFCSRYGIRCTWTGQCCSGSQHDKCKYTCACDATCTTVTNPSNVCITDPGPACCGTLCQTEWCKFQDLKCFATCTGGCCTYGNCVEEACDAQSCPPNACPGTCS